MPSSLIHHTQSPPPCFFFFSIKKTSKEPPSANLTRTREDLVKIAMRRCLFLTRFFFLINHHRERVTGLSHWTRSLQAQGQCNGCRIDQILSKGKVLQECGESNEVDKGARKSDTARVRFSPSPSNSGFRTPDLPWYRTTVINSTRALLSRGFQLRTSAKAVGSLTDLPSHRTGRVQWKYILEPKLWPWQG